MGTSIKRLGIFVVYDSQGIVDDYISYLLEDMCQNLAHLVIVCNGFINEEGIRKLKKFTDDVFIRENKEYDAGAIKDVLYKFYSWEKVYGFNELVLFNDSFFGPFYPLKIIFDKMNKSEIDFWGLSEQCAFLNDFPLDDQFVPYYLQSFFLVIKERLLKSQNYKSFWETMPPINTFTDAVTFYEMRMKPYFVEKGYVGEAFTSFSQLMSSNPTNNYLYTYDLPYEIILQCEYPILKRKALVSENSFILKSSNAEGYTRLMSHIDKQIGYDINLIWDNILRIYDIADLRYTMHLDKVLPSRARNSANNTLTEKRIAVIVQVSNPVLTGEVEKYLKQISSEIGVDIIANKTHKQNVMKDYEYICFVQDIEFKDNTAVSVMQSAVFTVLENTIKSPEYIENIINEFDENPRLGLLTPPHPLHSNHFSAFGGDWGGCFDEAQQFAQSLGVRKLSSSKRPFMSESAFWCRTKALKRLHDHDLCNGFTSAEMKALPYVAQNDGYYSAVVMSDSYAALQSTNCEYMLAKINDCQKRQPDSWVNEFGFNHFIIWYVYSKMANFCAKYKNIYIYGTGDTSGKCAKFLMASNISFEGFVISDGRPKAEESFGHTVRYLSELEPPGEKVGIILGMRKGDTAQVLPLLRQKGYENLFTMF